MNMMFRENKRTKVRLKNNNNNNTDFQMRIRGIEPRSVPWEGTMIPLHQMRSRCKIFTIFYLIEFAVDNAYIESFPSMTDETR